MSSLSLFGFDSKVLNFRKSHANYDVASSDTRCVLQWFKVLLRKTILCKSWELYQDNVPHRTNPCPITPTRTILYSPPGRLSTTLKDKYQLEQFPVGQLPTPQSPLGQLPTRTIAYSREDNYLLSTCTPSHGHTECCPSGDLFWWGMVLVWTLGSHSSGRCRIVRNFF